ncbi:MAG: DUF1559 domain-containing protein [Planctomycetota bacterium]|nr:MAG: DUF1559 domain-containing protein [Planctomycetota bacterium]
MPKLRPRQAFTLIELLVVVAIIALLISILLPSLRSAREQAKTTKCVANLKQVGNIMHMYFQEWRDYFPFEKHEWPAGGGPSSGWVMSAFYYGGHPGRPGAYEWDNRRNRYSFREKPFNRYVHNELLDRVETNAEVGTPEFDERRRELTIFQCPSDVGARFNNDSSADPYAFKPAHYYHGASYDINYHWVWTWAAGSGARAYSERTTAEKQVYLKIANNFLKIQRAKWASRFVMLFEDPFDNSMWDRVERIGWHRQKNRHSFLFLDGHAKNQYANPVIHGRWGPNWKTASGPWYNNPNDPDYRYRAIGP